MIQWLIKIFTKTLAKIELPYIHKGFPLKDYFKLEKLLKDEKVAVVLVTTYGSGSNLGIKFGQWFGKWKYSKKTHALLFVGRDKDKFKSMSVEAVGSGIQKISFLEAIGQRDEVKVMILRHDIFNEKMINDVVDFINTIYLKDLNKNIEYDNDHNLSTDDKYDCSELCYKAINFALKKNNSGFSISPVNRLGKISFAPSDLEDTNLLLTVYDNGFK